MKRWKAAGCGGWGWLGSYSSRSSPRKCARAIHFPLIERLISILFRVSQNETVAVCKRHVDAVFVCIARDVTFTFFSTESRGADSTTAICQSTTYEFVGRPRKYLQGRC